ncbi:MAG: GTPase [Herminiimonas sp.]|nr:GTPase [Herminiimonas sp.]
MSNLAQKFRQYSVWRRTVSAALERYRAWISLNGLSDAVSEQRLAAAIERLAQDRLTIAFVAEFSRGKSELINAIFFADYGKRILPSSAGRTTMCPTELLYDETLPPSIRLLPIETRAEQQSTSEFKEQKHVWTVLPLDVSSGDGMLEAFRQLSLTKRVPVSEAKSYGLFDEDDPDTKLMVDEAGMVEISRWRHAIVNFPHPLLKEGLIIVDTPGLNAIGTEPELTLNLIPNAHAVLFILAADTGVTRSDIEVWRNHIGNGGSKGNGAGRMVVLNKIDSMWDELRTPAQVQAQISGQVESVARLLAIEPRMVFPVSAQKGLVAKINRDPVLLARSRLPILEQALSEELIPSRQEIMRARLAEDFEDFAAERSALLAVHARNVVEQLMELKSLRGKNQNIVLHMMKRIETEKKDFDASLLRLQGTRAVFARLSFEVFGRLGMDVVKNEITGARLAMNKSMFTSGMREAVGVFFNNLRGSLLDSGHKLDEITEMMTVMYRKFSTEHGLALSTPMPFSLQKYEHELTMIEGIYRKQFSAAAMMTMSQVALMQKFFDSIASRAKHSFLLANRDVEAWLKVVMAPLESQIREHKHQLRQRRQSVERIHVATDDLEQKVSALEHLQRELEAQRRTLASLEAALRSVMNDDLSAFKVAA